MDREGVTEWGPLPSAEEIPELGVPGELRGRPEGLMKGTEREADMGLEQQPGGWVCKASDSGTVDCMVTPQRSINIPTPSTWDCDLTWK